MTDKSAPPARASSLPSGEPTVARQRRPRGDETDPNSPLAVALVGVFFGLLGLTASFFICAFVIILIAGIMGISALATRHTSNAPRFVALVASVVLLLVVLDLALLGFHFSQTEWMGAPLCW